MVRYKGKTDVFAVTYTLRQQVQDFEGLRNKCGTAYFTENNNTTRHVLPPS